MVKLFHILLPNYSNQCNNNQIHADKDTIIASFYKIWFWDYARNNHVELWVPLTTLLIITTFLNSIMINILANFKTTIININTLVDDVLFNLTHRLDILISTVWDSVCFLYFYSWDGKEVILCCYQFYWVSSCFCLTFDEVCILTFCHTLYLAAHSITN